ncbi:SGNH/GDSL hydrolase family protein [Bradyrhizobium tropiciagri]|uniref:SGNH/GDSL hydrolase family protein n=1 Tax=Bradyrhizobium tropiciagri TaxID=312253 RepID=UPI001BA48131|nr:SGNH/GDSL hydrolase family protein [Bradyrhizobium tropiciagri]MBR0872792.1 SGNH/GDSL hydrolase family protein [Bradyrhizobium tropiciagri]
MKAKTVALLTLPSLALGVLILLYVGRTHAKLDHHFQAFADRLLQHSARFAAIDQKLDRLLGQSSMVAAMDQQLDRLVQQSALLSPADMGNSRVDTRIFMINSQLHQASAPVVIVGDSITEAALLPSTICEQAVVNAGIGGTTPGLYATLVRTKGLLADMKAKRLVVALGTNNAQRSLSLSQFEADYRGLLAILVPQAEKVILAGIPPIEDGANSQYFDRSRVGEINRMIEDIAIQQGLPFVAFTGAMPTVDGVHMSPDGYRTWLGSIAGAVNRSLACGLSAVQ